MSRGCIAVAALLCTVLLVDAAIASGSRGAAGKPRFSSGAAVRVGENPFRLVAADLNADGNPDLATADWTSATVSVALGKGTGSFRKRAVYRTAGRPTGITAADVDGDGDPDLVSSSRSGPVSVFTNWGSGGFSRTASYAAGRRTYAVAAGDVNQDGTIDLVSAHYDRDHLAVLLGTGAGRFILAQRYSGRRATDVAVGDLNGDGRPDLALAAGNSNAVVVRLGAGDGTFGAEQRYVSRWGPFGVTLADFNHDDKLDIAAANYSSGSVGVFLGGGAGAFGARTRYAMGYEGGFTGVSNVDTVVVADLDRDGHLDMATPEYFRPRVRRGNGDGTFQDQRRASAGYFPTVGGAVADFDRDGWPDLAFSGACDSVELDCDAYPARSAYVFLNWTGRAEPPCVVPDLRFWRLRAAGRLLRRAGCRLGHVSHRRSRKAPRGRLIRQRPRIGTVLPTHSRVDIVLSSGRRR